MTVGAYLQVLRKRWLTVVAVVVLCIAAAGLITTLMPKSYVAQSTSFVSIAGAKTSQPGELFQNSQFALNQVQSYPAIVTSPSVLGPVIDQLGLDLSVRQLKSMITVTNPPETVLLQVQATSSSPKLAQAIANAVSEKLGTLLETLETPRRSGDSPVKITNAVPASLPTEPASPRPVLNLLLGALLGLALGAVAAATRQRLDTSVRSLADLEELSGASPLGVVRRDKRAEQRPLMVIDQHNPTIEDFRTIRTNLRYVDVDRPAPRQIVVTSAIAGEGKSIFACNLALVMAQAQLRVCLVEADLRRPKVTQYFGLDGSIGLADVVAGERSLDDALVPWNRGQLTVLPAGATPPDPGQLLGSNAADEMMQKLRAEYDLVIIDAPPLLPVSDAAVLGAMSDGLILIARHGHVSKDQVRHTVQAISSVGAHLIGTVLNASPAKERSARYGPDYGYEAQDQHDLD